MDSVNRTALACFPNCGLGSNIGIVLRYMQTLATPPAPPGVVRGGRCFRVQAFARIPNLRCTTEHHDLPFACSGVLRHQFSVYRSFPLSPSGGFQFTVFPEELA